MTCRSPGCRNLAGRSANGRPSKGTLRGWCEPCYHRWRRHGRPADVAPPPQGSGSRGPKADRFEDYAWLRVEHGHTRAEAAARVGVSWRTGQRYDAELRRAA